MIRQASLTVGGGCSKAAGTAATKPLRRSEEACDWDGVSEGQSGRKWGQRACGCAGRKYVVLSHNIISDS